MAIARIWAGRAIQATLIKILTTNSTPPMRVNHKDLLKTISNLPTRSEEKGTNLPSECLQINRPIHRRRRDMKKRASRRSTEKTGLRSKNIVLMSSWNAESAEESSIRTVLISTRASAGRSSNRRGRSSIHRNNV